MSNVVLIAYLMAILVGFAEVPSEAYGGSESPIQSQTPQSFIPVFTWFYNRILSRTQENLLSKHSFSDLIRASYEDNLGRNTWQALKSLNPTHEVYLYEFSFGSYDSQDKDPALKINTILRWTNSRGHSMGNLDTNHPELFLLDSKGRRIHDSYGVWVMDIGLQSYIDYWVEAVKADIINMPCKADGIFIDGPPLILPLSLSASPIKYPTNEKWASTAASFISGVTSALHAKKVKVWFNVGETTNSACQLYWLSLDSAADHPDILMDESMFASSYVPGFVGFCSEAACKTAIETMQHVKNIRVASSSHIKGLPGDSGVDNFGKPVTYWDAFYFALSCFLLGKNTVDNNSYFSWHDGSKAISWFDEFDIDLGNSVGDYQITKHGTANVYWREYERGYVYANLSNTDLSGIKLSNPCRRVTHDNVTAPFGGSIITSLDLPAHRGAILLKPSAKSWRSI